MIANASDHVQLSPLSIQAASLVRSIEALSRIFWISLGGTILTIFFAGLSELEANAATDFISLGEYQVPKAILPLAGLSFALFAFWLTNNRLNMLSYVLETTALPKDMVHEIFHLNPPVLNIFDRECTNPWSPLSGVSVLVINWAIFFGNSIAVTWASAVQYAASFASFNIDLLVFYGVSTLLVGWYGLRTLVPPIRQILSLLHDVDFQIGWPRLLLGIVLLLGVIGVFHFDKFVFDDNENDLVGPTFANAVDGETLLIDGVEFKLFGIDAVEPDQVCQNADGTDYPCGRLATYALQSLVQQNEVICLPFFAVNEQTITGACELVVDDEPLPMEPADIIGGEFRPNNLSRLLVAQGHAIGVGIGRRLFREEQRQAQTLREGIWSGSFQPPASWRTSH